MYGSSKFPAMIGVSILLVAANFENCRADDVITDLSKRDVPIEWNFTGTRILLFGAIEKSYVTGDQSDVIIVVRGPKEDVTIRRKVRVAGVWINADPTNFEEIPGYYSLASTRPIAEIASAETLQKLGIGLDALAHQLSERSGRLKDEKADEFSEALVRILQEDNLYQQNDGDIKILGDTLFRATIELPANVPVGKFTADVYLFKEHKLLSIHSSTLNIQKQGFERLVYSLAFDYPLIYGIVAVIIALLAGLAASALFRRD